MEKWRPPSPEGLVESHPVLWAEELGLRHPNSSLVLPLFHHPWASSSSSCPIPMQSQYLIKDRSTFVFISFSPADTCVFFKHLWAVILQLTANVLLMTLSDCQGWEGISRILDSPSLSFLFVCQFPLRCPNVHQPHSGALPDTPGQPHFYRHHTPEGSRAHSIALPLLKFQAKPNISLF